MTQARSQKMWLWQHVGERKEAQNPQQKCLKAGRLVPSRTDNKPNALITRYITSYMIAENRKLFRNIDSGMKNMAD